MKPTKYIEFIATDKTMTNEFNRIYRESREQSGGKGAPLELFRERMKDRFRMDNIIRIVDENKLEQISKLDSNLSLGISYYPIVNGEILLSGLRTY